MNEVRWQGTGKITPGTFEIFYSSGIEYERGVAINWIKPRVEQSKDISHYQIES